MPSKTFNFRMSSQGAESVIADLRKLAIASAEGQRALEALTRASPQLASVQDGVTAKLRQTTQALREQATASEGFSSFLQKFAISPVSGALAGAASVTGFAAGILQIAKAGDEATASIARLASVVGGNERAGTLFQELFGVSRQTGVSDTAATFQRFAIAAKDLGTTNAQIVELVAGIQKFGIVAGASTEEVKLASVQLGQALASGKLQGDELRSIMEQMPQLAQALAKELNTSVGALKAMGSEGKLTSDVVMPALLSAVKAIDAEFSKMPLTMARATEQFTVSAQAFLAHVDQAIGLSQKLAGIMSGIARDVDFARRGIGGATLAERRAGLEADAASIDARLAEMERAQQPGISRQRNRGALVRPMVEDRETLLRQREETRRELLQINNQIVRQEEADFEAAQESRLTAQRTASAEQIKSLREELDKSIKLRREHADMVKVIDRGVNLGTIGAADAAKLRSQADKDLADGLEKLTEKAKGSDQALKAAARAAEHAQKAFEKATKDARGIESELDPVAGAFYRLQEQLNRINDAVANGFLTGDRSQVLQNVAYRRLTDELDKFNNTTNETSKDVDRFFANMASKTEDAIIHFKSLRDVARAIGEDLAGLILRRTVTNPLAEAASKGVNGIFDSLFGSSKSVSSIPTTIPIGSSSLAGFNVYANGGIMTGHGPVPLRRYSGGGIADNPQLALFGEGSTPEAYVPLPDGRAIPVRMQGSDSRGRVHNNTTINVNVIVPNTNASPAVIAGEVRRAVADQHAKFIDEIQRGGAAAQIVGRRRR